MPLQPTTGLEQYFSELNAFEGQPSTSKPNAEPTGKPKILEEHVAGKHAAQPAPAKPKEAVTVKQPPLNSEPNKKPTSGVSKPATEVASTALKTKIAETTSSPTTEVKPQEAPSAAVTSEAGKR